MKPPQRRFKLELTCEGHTKKDLIGTLRHYLHLISTESTNVVSGDGYFTVVENVDAPNKEEHEKLVSEYVDYLHDEEAKNAAEE